MKFPFALTMLLAFIFLGCNKYEEGPKISLRARTERLANTWDYDKLEINSEDYSDEIQGAILEIQKDGDWKERNALGELVAYGTWEWEDDQERVKLNYEQGDDPIDPLKMKILRLAEHELFLEYSVGDVYVYVEFGD